MFEFLQGILNKVSTMKSTVQTKTGGMLEDIIKGMGAVDEQGNITAGGKSAHEEMLKRLFNFSLGTSGKKSQGASSIQPQKQPQQTWQDVLQVLLNMKGK